MYEQGAEKSTVAGGVIALGNTKLFYSHSNNEGVQKSRGDMIGAAHKIGAYTVKASYGRTNTDIKAYNVGAEYALSKRTDILVSYRNVDQVAAANDVKQIGVGITHRFWSMLDWPKPYQKVGFFVDIEVIVIYNQLWKQIAS